MDRRAKVDMADKESKIKELTEPVGTSLLRLFASNPSDFIKNVVAKIIALKDRLATKPDLVMDGLGTLPVEDIIKLPSGLGISHSRLRVFATAKACKGALSYPAAPEEEIGEIVPTPYGNNYPLVN